MNRVIQRGADHLPEVEIANLFVDGYQATVLLSRGAIKTKGAAFIRFYSISYTGSASSVILAAITSSSVSK